MMGWRVDGVGWGKGRREREVYHILVFFCAKLKCSIFSSFFMTSVLDRDATAATQLKGLGCGCTRLSWRLGGWPDGLLHDKYTKI